MSEANKQQDVVSKVTQGGYCIGCGACAHLSTAVSMQANRYGQLIPVVTEDGLSNTENDTIAKVCPSGPAGLNEDQIAELHFGTLPRNSRIGHFDKVFAGKVTTGEFYQKASSGGIGKWLLTRLLELGDVDYVIQVTEDQRPNERGLSYFYKVFSKTEEIKTGSKSAYYPIELSEVLDFVRQNPGRYAITGIPCFIKTIRRLCEQDSELKQRIKFTLGVVCGHLKTKAFAELIGWQLGVKPDELATVDFREKLPGKKANQKGVRATRLDGSQSDSEIVQNLFGTNYGHGLFKYNACDFCDDVLAETADVAVGDAWLPQYMHGGTSLVVTRNKRITEILAQYRDIEVQLDELTDTDAANSQAAGLRHRREYLSYRLLLKQQAGHWAPLKRVLPADAHLTRNQKRIVVLRSQISDKSHELFAKAKELNDLSYLKKHLLPLMEEMHDLRLSGWKFLLVRFLRTVKVYDLLARYKKK
ncbi:Coenzyme F420 hydrogenase/dehydrogenase, beta subunit C-terminal domain [Planctobacterium marinum]|uniref:Coenzyme F420 hydrogenase/dehydrogenase, beta subunit C-terminal domain n=1 Tax=Planctobacterium marinum TaxID=1631968 RepID=UPI001E2E2957|nr:Coenzyme F420 hydrogenase/dehydrogenase, beta subunit C-terminal domain [Planctobacterium marinum]MCC2606092.1 Coenzyme F420 hydrogenase/dehydrogenase, beta subunit C-terminal domain [Planctobacterium marinum]